MFLLLEIEREQQVMMVGRGTRNFCKPLSRAIGKADRGKRREERAANVSGRRISIMNRQLSALSALSSQGKKQTKQSVSCASACVCECVCWHCVCV